MARWIQEVAAHSHGQFREKAQKAGMTTRAFARHVMANKGKYSKKTVKQANAALNMMNAAKNR